MSTADRVGAPARPARTAPPAESAPPARTAVTAVGVVAAVALGVAIEQTAGWAITATYVLGLLLGAALFHSRFGFTSAFRQLVSVGQGRSLRAHMLMLAAGCVLFAVVLHAGATLTGKAPHASVEPAGLGVALGAFLFGIGMQVGGSCASGTLFSVGSGQTSIAFTLGGFVIGSVLATFAANWISSVQALGPTVDFAATPLGHAGGVLITLAITGAVVALSLLVERRRTPPPAGNPPSARGLLRIVRGSWPIWAGALALAALNAATLLVSGKPWGITSAFALWGTKLLGLVGIDVSGNAYWAKPGNAHALHASVLADQTSVMDFGIMLGALIASALAGAFALHRAVPPRIALGAVLGGIAMGFGARVAGGCNIGAYFAGIVSFSLHGWLWGVAAIAGTYVGLALRPLFGLGNPKPSDSVC